jgi:pimeloyl-ACP methyl ester carboxylesterase
VPKVNANGIVIAYEEQGSGEPLVLLGGFAMTKESWIWQMDALSHHLRVIAMDNRGVGESTVPAEPFTIADMAADAIGLLDALSIPAAHVFGVSMGGLIAQTLALDYPERVKKAALGCTTHGGRHAVQPQPEVMAILAKAADPAITPEQAVRMRLPILFTERFLREEVERREAYVRNASDYAPTPRGAGGQMRAMSRFNVRDRLGEIRAPVLVITGIEDRMMPSENSRLLAEAIPGARLHMVEGAGHAFYQEKPDEVNRVLLEFLSTPRQ